MSCLTYCAFILLNRTSSEGSSPSLNTLIQLSIASSLLLPFAWNWGLPSTDQLPWLVAIGFLTGFLAMLLAISALAHLPATTYGTLAYLEPFTVAVLAWWFFGESLSLSDALGASLIVIAGLGQSRLSLRSSE
jgi:drug/metabolite transporter (DMT)-like permease